MRWGWYVSIVVFVIALFGPAPMGNVSYKYNEYHAAIYAAFGPMAWCLLFAWIIYSSHIGHTSRDFLTQNKYYYYYYIYSFHFGCRLFKQNALVERISNHHTIILCDLFNPISYILFQRGQSKAFGTLPFHHIIGNYNFSFNLLDK